MKQRSNIANEKAAGLQSDGFEKCASNAKDFTGSNPAQLELRLEIKAARHDRKARKHGIKSTAVEAQYQRIDRLFDAEGKKITTLDFRKAGVIHPSGRIKEMNEKLGYYIPTVALRSIYDDEGFLHPRIAVYELIDRPKQERGAAV